MKFEEICPIEFEFGGIDVLVDLRRYHSRPSKTLVAENQIENQQIVQNFLDNAAGNSLKESELVVGEYYYPIDLSINVDEMKITILMVIEPAQFVGYQGSRLIFRYVNSEIDLHFPDEESLGEDEDQFFYREKSALDAVIFYLILQFKGTEWDVMNLGYNQSGKIQRITNLK